MTNRAITRRKVIVMGLVTPAVLFTATSATSAAPSTALLAAIAAHETAWRTYEGNCHLSDEIDPRFDSARLEEVENMGIREEETRHALLAFRVRSSADLSAKFHYISRQSETFFPDEQQTVRILLQAVQL